MLGGSAAILAAMALPAGAAAPTRKAPKSGFASLVSTLKPDQSRSTLRCATAHLPLRSNSLEPGNAVEALSQAYSQAPLESSASQTTPSLYTPSLYFPPRTCLRPL